MSCLKTTGAIHCHVQLIFPDTGIRIKGLVVCNGWDLEPLDLLNGLALVGCPMRYIELYL